MFRGAVELGAAAAALLVSTALTVCAYHARERSESMHELARLALEDVSRRVEQSSRNLRSVRSMNDAVAISRARSLAEMIKADPTLLDESSRCRFDALAADLNVDELHVSDARGVLVRSFPSRYEGGDMSSSAQSAEFMPAITNADFALVQEPQCKGLDAGDDRCGSMFQYAGVARRDAPGIVQVGYRAERVAEAMRLADVGEIVATTRVGRDGRVRIEKVAPGSRPASREVRVEVDGDGRRCSVFEADTCEYRISVVMPEVAPVLGSDRAIALLVSLDLLFFMLVLALVPAVRGVIARDFRVLRGELGSGAGRASSLARMATSPLSVSAFAFFAAVIAVIWIVASRQAYRDACDKLKASAADMVHEIDNCVDAQLAFVGHELCHKYASPEAMAAIDLKEAMATYFLDEINVVAGDGVCVASTVKEICGQDQWSLANPAKFCQSLIVDGNQVFSQPFRESATEPGVFRKYVGVAFPPPAKGYVQIGFERVRLQSSVDYRLKPLAINWHIGESGFFIISKTSNGLILSSPGAVYDGKTVAEVGFDVFAARNNQNVDDRDPVTCDFLGFRHLGYFVASFNGVECLCTSGVVNQFHRYVAALPLSEVYGPSRRDVAVTAAALLVALVLVVFFMTRMSDLVASLKGFIAKDKERRERDLAISKTIQTSSLPVVFPDKPTWKIFARMITAREVGGDFYDFYELPSGKVFFLIADVSGKGVPAAMFMMRAKTTIRACMFGCPDLGQAICRANNALSDNNEANMFVTAWLGTFDPATGEVEYVNAGHNAPLVRRADGSVEWVRLRSGVVLAAMGGYKYRVDRLHLAPGDSVFLYTDGVTEAMNESGELYGERRLEAAMRASDELFVQFVLRDVERFAGGAERSDDITMLALDFKKQTKGE